MTAVYILLALAAGVAGYVILTFNRLVKGRNLVQEGWSGIDVQLKRRANLVPNLVETVKGYAGHERATLERVAALRGQSLKAEGLAEKGQVEGMLGAAIGRLLAIAEAYPELKANENFRHLQQELAEIEEQIQFARRYYNGAVRDQNVLIESFPSNLVAGSLGFRPAAFFEIAEAAEREVPQVSFS
jgi:LemA protein